MKRLLIRFLACAMVLVVATPQLFAGIPIQTPPNAKQEVRSVQQKKKVHRRVSRLKQKITKKLLKLDVEEGDNKTAAIVFAILIPFVGVAIYQDGVGRDFWITLLLTALLYIPGLIYALTIILR